MCDTQGSGTHTVTAHQSEDGPVFSADKLTHCLY